MRNKFKNNNYNFLVPTNLFYYFYWLLTYFKYINLHLISCCCISLSNTLKYIKENISNFFGSSLWTLLNLIILLKNLSNMSYHHSLAISSCLKVGSLIRSNCIEVPNKGLVLLSTNNNIKGIERKESFLV